MKVTNVLCGSMREKKFPLVKTMRGAAGMSKTFLQHPPSEINAGTEMFNGWKRDERSVRDYAGSQIPTGKCYAGLCGNVLKSHQRSEAARCGAEWG